MATALITNDRSPRRRRRPRCCYPETNRRRAITLLAVPPIRPTAVGSSLR